MQIMGASEALVQAPFVVEGMILGLSGAAISVGALWGVFLILRRQLSALGGVFLWTGDLQFIDPAAGLLIVAIGWLLGAAGSLFSLRSFIRTWKRFAWQQPSIRWRSLTVLALLGAGVGNQDLEGIKKKIESEKKGLSQLQIKEGSVRESLSKVETELAEKNGQLKTAKLGGRRCRKKWNQRNSKASSSITRSRRGENFWQQRAAALYRWQRGGSPLVILNGAASLSQFLRRQHYLQGAISFDRDLVTKLQDESARLAVVQEQLAKKKSELDGQKQAIALAQGRGASGLGEKKDSVGELRPGKRNPPARAQTDGSGRAAIAKDDG